MKITTVYFSATNTTKKIITSIAQGMEAEVHQLDITSHPISEKLVIPKEELLLVGMPVYGGRIPSVAVASLQQLRGEHTAVILVAVYGNRDYEDALVEMQDIFESNGFFVLAAGAFIAQHSVFPHTAKGRPDALDIQKTKDFAKLCRNKAQQRGAAENKSVALPGNRPYKIPGNIPLKVITNEKCTECGACIRVCPVGAIPLDNPHATDYDKCIHCGRCIFVCSTHARGYTGMLYNMVGKLFGWKNRKRKEPEFFI